LVYHGLEVKMIFGRVVYLVMIASLLTGGAAIAAGSSAWDSRMASAGRDYRLGRYQEAQDVLEEMLTDAKNSGQQDLQLAEVANNLAEVLSAQGQYEEAEPLYKQAMAIRLQRSGPTSNDLAISITGLADVYRALGRSPEALQLLRRALKIAAHINESRTMGGEFQGDERFLNNLLQNPASIPGSPELARVLVSFGAWYEERGQYDVAVKMYKKVVDILDVPAGQDVSVLYRKPWEGGNDLGQGLIRLADVYMMRSQPVESERLYKQALSYRQRALGVDHPKVAQARKKLAEFYRRENRNSEADELER
jgi:tetratricopeptide (TPR) repeat protein